MNLKKLIFELTSLTLASLLLSSVALSQPKNQKPASSSDVPTCVWFKNRIKNWKPAPFVSSFPVRGDVFDQIPEFNGVLFSSKFTLKSDASGKILLPERPYAHARLEVFQSKEGIILKKIDPITYMVDADNRFILFNSPLKEGESQEFVAYYYPYSVYERLAKRFGDSFHLDEMYRMDLIAPTNDDFSQLDGELLISDFKSTIEAHHRVTGANFTFDKRFFEQTGVGQPDVRAIARFLSCYGAKIKNIELLDQLNPQKLKSKRIIEQSPGSVESGALY